MFFSLSQILNWLIIYKYLVLFPIAVIEGPIITIISGFLVSLGSLNFLTAYLVLISGDMVGDLFYYSLGYFGRIQFINRWGKYLGFKLEQISALEKHYSKHGGKTLLLGKFTQIGGGPVLVTAGIIKMPLKKFLFYNFVFTVPKSLVLLIVGFYFGQAYEQINKYYNKIGLIITILLFIVLGVYIFWRLLKKRSS